MRKNAKKQKSALETVENGKETSEGTQETGNIENFVPEIENFAGNDNRTGTGNPEQSTQENGPGQTEVIQTDERGDSEQENPEQQGNETNVDTKKRKYTKRNKTEPETKQPETPDFDVFSDLEKFAKSSKESVAPEKTPIITKGKKSKNDMLITGYMLLIFCDLAIPTVICLVYKMSGQGEVKATDLQLEKEQLDSLVPIADQAAKELMLHVNPVWMFFGALSGMYLSKLYMVTQ